MFDFLPDFYVIVCVLQTVTHLIVPLSAGGTSLTLSIGDKSGSDEESGVKVDGDVRAVMSAATDPVETWSWVALLW